MNVYVIFLNWDEVCFRADTAFVRFVKSQVPEGSRVVWAKSEETFLNMLPIATHVFVWYFKKEWFLRAKKLRVLATPAAGREFVPTEAPKGVRIHFGHFHGDMMAETVAAFILAWSRGFLYRHASVWPRIWMSDKLTDVAGTRAVILGYGNVGRAIGRKLTALGVEVFGYSRHLKIRRETLDRQIRVADWLILALPGGPGTNCLLDARLIARLPKRCFVINVGRGTTVDEAALFKALKEHRLAGAYLDVRTTEPYRRFALPGGTAGLPPAPKMENLILMPHAAAFSPRYLERFIRELKNDRCL